jgi:hypothetical protein
MEIRASIGRGGAPSVFFCGLYAFRSGIGVNLLVCLVCSVTTPPTFINMFCVPSDLYSRNFTTLFLVPFNWAPCSSSAFFMRLCDCCVLAFLCSWESTN